MAQLGVSRSEFLQLLKSGDAGKLYDALARGIQDWDFDSAKLNGGKFTAKPAGGVFYHKLGVTPREVKVLGSDTLSGANYVQENATAVTKESVTVGGSKAFYRILAER